MNNPTPKVMLLVDADNVSPDVMAQAFDRVLAQHGAVHVRRAYCTAESAAKHLPLFKKLSMRPIVNISTGKNSTDIALAVDAISLVEAERPDVVVIVSSDSDFAPLVIRLREKGCRVEGIGQTGKTGEDSVGVYDDFIDLTHRKATGRAPAKTSRRGSVATPVTAPVPAPMPVLVQAPAPAPVTIAAPLPAAPAKRGRTRLPSRAAQAQAPVPAPPPIPVIPEDVRLILQAVPEFSDGGKVELGIAAERLRGANLLAKNAPSTKLFKKHLEHFVLTPERQPNKVQYRGPVLK